ncbi:sigma-54-dependent transcriptional regulator [Deferrisoma camini]|uniref:sigma-54-dependent transcriptional regulator n=1 Tax=Deferrisoma camini TaxID=1035120 RepID=UPI00046CF221|nr:sigma-54 dependent transcriptional regulator [Deferrisoma camini]
MAHPRRAENPTEHVPRILVVDDEVGMLDLLRRVLEREGYAVETASSAEQAELFLAGTPFDLVITDLVLGGRGGEHVVRVTKSTQPETEILVITAHASVDSAVEVMREGAFDYLRKPLLPEEILHVVRRALEMKGLRDEVRTLRREKAAALLQGELLGRSPAMLRVFERVRRAARTDATVLLEGESGTGKELVARAIHAESRRASGPFVPVNCGAIPGDLLESELFGHVRGAFTGAHADRQGYFEAASGGTLFLDEIGEMDPRLQVKLLRVLQDSAVTRVGETRPRPVDVRIVAATNRRLLDAVQDGSFRNDLYYRLRVVHIELPPLRERREDILLLAHAFLQRFARAYGKGFEDIDPRAARTLQRYDYPGNVRELRNIIESAVVMGRGKIIHESHLREAMGEEAFSRASGAPAEWELPFDEALARVVEEFERAYLEHNLRRFGGRIKNLIQASGLSRRTIERKMARYGLSRRDFVPGRGPGGGSKG